MVTRLDDLVNYNGRVATINLLDKDGLIEFKKTDKFYSKRTENGLCTKYFANIKSESTEDGASSGWEISRFAYNSKVKIC